MLAIKEVLDVLVRAAFFELIVLTFANILRHHAFIAALLDEIVFDVATAADK